MSDLALRPYEPSDASVWDAFLEESWNGTFLHSRRFMAHHGDRFDDRSLLITDAKDRLVGLLPAAVDPHDDRTVVSHPGLTYGGIVRGRRLAGSDLVAVIDQMLEYFAGLGFRALRYKAVPHIYHRVPAGDDLFALAELGARRVLCELTTPIPLTVEAPAFNSLRKRRIRKAADAGVEVAEGADGIDGFWQVLNDNLRERYNVAPVHSAEELHEFARILPDNVRCVVGRLDGEVLAGTIIFETPIVTHTQYLSSNHLGQEIGALDIVIAQAIDGARDRGRWYFNLGTSSDRPASRLNEGLHRWKLSFGGGGAPHDVYEVNVPASAESPVTSQ
jgi:hypothetical protein